MRESEYLEYISPDIKQILKKGISDEEIGKEEALKLLKVTSKEFLALQYASNKICIENTDNIVTFVVNRNINFTNICYQRCKFCSFSVPKNDEDSFLLSIKEIKEKVKQAKRKEISEVCIQGGINPDVRYEYYLKILREIKSIFPKIHIHAFSPQEVFHMAKISNQSIEETLKDLKSNGLDSMPGTAAEILVDRLREVICPNKIDSNQWREIVEKAHEIGIPSTSTLMYGHIESLNDRVEHLNFLREIQKETGGFTEFVPLPYVSKNPLLSKLDRFPLNPTYGMDDLKLFAVSRIFFKGFINNIQCSWVKLGPKLAQVSLNYGVNDFSGTLMEENISRSAGGDYGQELTAEEIVNIIKSAGKKPAQRSTTYKILKYY